MLYIEECVGIIVGAPQTQSVKALADPDQPQSASAKDAEPDTSPQPAGHRSHVTSEA
jgi:hypothetical protein